MNEAQKTRYAEDFGLYNRAVNQQRNDKDKVYSLHKSFKQCIAKGKPHKQYEFGNKVGLVITGKKGKKVITAIKAFLDNPYDGHTIKPLHDQMNNNELKQQDELVYDRGRKQG